MRLHENKGLFTDAIQAYTICRISSFLTDFLIKSGNESLVTEYEMHPFDLYVLDKRRTLTEKLVSLMRCSLSDNYLQELSAKIRHFYDLHFLVKDSECLEYLEGEDFKNDFEVLLSHDRALFSKPHSWQDEDIADSPLLTDMNGTWSELQETYSKEMPDLAYKVIPEGGEILESIKKILERIS